MTVKNSTEKNPEKNSSDRFSCYLCGEDEVYSGIVFKGHCVCEDCVEYVCSGKMTEDGRLIFPPEEQSSNEKSAKTPSDSETAENDV